MREERHVVTGRLLVPHWFSAVDCVVFRSSATGMRRSVELAIVDRVLQIDGERVPPERHVAGYVQPVAGGGRARLCLLDDEYNVEIDVELSSEKEADEVLVALGLPTQRMAVPFRAVWYPGALVGIAGLIFGLSAAVALFRQPWMAALVAIPLLIIGIATMRASRHPIIVAPDGVLIERFGRRRFIGYDGIESVKRDSDTGVRLELRGGRKIVIEFEAEVGGQMVLSAALKSGGAPVNKAVVELIQKHLDARGSTGLGARLARRGRPLKRWLADLDRLLRGDYREQSPTPEQLWSVIEDGAANPSARAAAARLLRPRGDADKQRLRIVADNAASPKLRIALKSVDDDDQAAQREALAAMEAVEDAPDHPVAPG